MQECLCQAFITRGWSVYDIQQSPGQESIITSRRSPDPEAVLIGRAFKIMGSHVSFQHRRPITLLHISQLSEHRHQSHSPCNSLSQAHLLLNSSATHHIRNDLQYPFNLSTRGLSTRGRPTQSQGEHVNATQTPVQFKIEPGPWSHAAAPPLCHPRQGS